MNQPPGTNPDQKRLRQASLSPGSRTSDESLLRRGFGEPSFLHSDAWRLFRIQAEFVEGIQSLAGLPQAVSIFGSARTQSQDQYYDAAREVGFRLGKEGYAIITGGGPGIMEAANRGAHEAGAISVGLNIELPFEQYINHFVTVPLSFRYFFVRKMMFVKYAEAFVVFPGGFGTLDELFEALTLIQTDKLRHFPVVLFGSGYWDGLLSWMREQMLEFQRIKPEDLELFCVTDSVSEVVEHIVRTQPIRDDDEAQSTGEGTK